MKISVLLAAAFRAGPSCCLFPHRCNLRRRAYQRAIAVPTDAVDDLWRAYEAFEFSGPNRTLAKRLVDEHRPVYQLVRRLHEVP